MKCLLPILLLLCFTLSMKALANEAMNAQLQQNIRTYELTSENGKDSSMPQTIIEDKIMYGPAGSVDHVKASLKKILNLE